MALGFEVPDNFVIPVTYAKNLLKAEIQDIKSAADVDLTSRFARDLLSTKFLDWSYENESRVFLKLDPSTCEGGLFFHRFGFKLKLVEVILGARCPIHINRLRKLVATYPHKVHVKRARIAFTNYRVVENRKSRAKV